MTYEDAIKNLQIALAEVNQCIDNADVSRVPEEAYVMQPSLEMAIKALERQSKIVFCKDCKYSHMTISGECKYCDIHSPEESVYFPGDYFCANGER